MCGRFISGADEISWKEYCDILRLPTTPPVPEGGDANPTQSISIIRQGAGAERELAEVRWGLLPPWVEDFKEARKLFNVRSETAADKFGFAFRHGRCLIPARAFYEWRKPSSGRKKIPYFIRDEARPIFSMAGIWSTWKKAEEPLETCAILTTAANPSLRPIHHRMPVILDDEGADLWLSGGPLDELRELLIPYESETLLAEPLGPPPELPAQGTLF